MDVAKKELSPAKRYLYRVASSLFYGAVSFALALLTKPVLSETKFGFPFLLLYICQMTIAIVSLFSLKMLKYIQFPDFSWSTLKITFPVPVINAGDIALGLGATRDLSVPMFTVLRKGAIVFTILAELWLLKVRPSLSIILSVAVMIAGAIIAAVNDLSFSLLGYIFVIANDVSSAFCGIFIKKKLDTSYIGIYGLLFYNSLLMIVPMLVISWAVGEFSIVAEFKHWNNPTFLSLFVISAFGGVILDFSMFKCIEYNSVLTMSMVETLKNILVTYIGMFTDDTYKYDLLNVIGLTISSVAAIVYAYFEFKNSKEEGQVGDSDQNLPKLQTESDDTPDSILLSERPQP